MRRQVITAVSYLKINVSNPKIFTSPLVRFNIFNFDALLDDMSDTGIRIVTATAREIAEGEGE